MKHRWFWFGGFTGILAAIMVIALVGYAQTLDSINHIASNTEWIIGTGGDLDVDGTVTLDGTMTVSATGEIDGSAGAVVIGIGAFPPATCTAGEIFIDTAEGTDTNCTTTSDNSLCLCVATDTWAQLDNN
jgi:hypothetical protein